jgi:RHS repeat-associated protein
MVLVKAGGERWVHVGSINGSEASSKVNREMALQVESDEVYEYLAEVFWCDWDGCGWPTPTPTATATATPTSTPTFTPTPTPTSIPSPTPTPTPLPTPYVIKYYYADGKRVAMRVLEGGGERLLFIHSDHLGSINLITDEIGGRIAERRFYPYGEVRWRKGAFPTDYGFTGQIFDNTIGLYFYKSRWYNDKIGRFISADTLVPNVANPQDINRYSYVRNNPLRYTDPSGHYILLEEEFGVRITKEGVADRIDFL